MAEQLLNKVNDSQLRWRQVDAEMLNSKNSYMKHLEVCYDLLRESTKAQTDLLNLLLQMVPRPAPAPAPAPAPQTGVQIEEVEEARTRKRADNISS